MKYRLERTAPIFTVFIMPILMAMITSPADGSETGKFASNDDLYKEFISLPSSDSRKWETLKECAERSHPPCMREMGEYVFSRAATSEQRIAGFVWASRAANAGDGLAKGSLGYKKRSLTEQELAKAEEILDGLSSAAENREIQQSGGRQTDTAVPAVISAADKVWIEWAQSHLQKMGYYRGKIDGAYGPRTEAAIRRAINAFDLSGFDIREFRSKPIAETEFSKLFSFLRYADMRSDSFSNDLGFPADLRGVQAGSGFLLTDDGYFVTNHHVIKTCRAISIGERGNHIGAVLAGENVQNDLVILKLKSIDAYPVTFPASMDFELGDTAYAAGFPMTQMLGNNLKFTDGAVSGLFGPNGDPRYFQITAAADHGSSGGPIFDSKGRVIGVLTSGFRELENVSYAVKFKYVESLARKVGSTIHTNRRNNDLRGRDIAAIAKSSVRNVWCWRE